MSLSEKAYDIIKNQIIFKKTDDRYISVRTTARNLHMSYTPVREAFKNLEREGLLERVPNLGYLIPKISNRDIDEIFQVRECLELFVLEKIFSSLTEEDVEILDEHTEEMEKTLREKNTTEFYNKDKKFHMYFFEKYNNSHLTKSIKNIRERYHVCSQTLIVGGKAGVKQVVKEHKDIIKGIKNNDKQKTLNTLRESIRNSKKRLKNGNIRVY